METPLCISTQTLQRLQEYATSCDRDVADVADEAINRYLRDQEGNRGPFHQQQQQQQQPDELEQAPSAELQLRSSLSSRGRLTSRQLGWLRQQSLTPLYLAEPIISLVDGLLEGDHCVADCLAKGNFGLGTLDFLDGEVVVLDGVAYHQSEGGVKVLQGPERTPFMSVTMFERSRCKQFELGPVTDLESLESQLQAHFRSKNVVYAILVEGTFPYIKVRAVCKQQGHVRLKEVAKQQIVSEHVDESGVLVSFWSPHLVGASLNWPGFHIHYLSSDKKRGGHLLQLQAAAGAKVSMMEIHRAQVDLPFRDDFLDSQLQIAQASAELAAAELEPSSSS